jgi:hypothetical protein
MPLKCHHCSTWLGESPAPVWMVGIFHSSFDARYVSPPRATYRCKSCGWVTVFKPDEAPRHWRDDIDLKAS